MGGIRREIERKVMKKEEYYLDNDTIEELIEKGHIMPLGKGKVSSKTWKKFKPKLIELILECDLPILAVMNGLVWITSTHSLSQIFLAGTLIGFGGTKLFFGFKKHQEAIQSFEKVLKELEKLERKEKNENS
jgi:hypothetical protein